MNAESHTAAFDDPIDQQTIQELRAEGEDLLSDLVEMFAREVPNQLATLDAALVQGDARATRLSAHTLKGTGGNFGATRMQDARRRDSRKRAASVRSTARLRHWFSCAPNASGSARRSKPCADAFPRTC